MRSVQAAKRRAASITLITMLFAGIGAGAIASPQSTASLKEGDPVSLDGRGAILTRLDALPYVDSDFTRRFRFDSYDNPKLKQLREQFRLDEVVAPGKDEFHRQLLLLDWVNHRFKKF